MKTVKTIVAAALLAIGAAQVNAASLPGVERNTATFLKALEGGKPIEQMSPEEARAVLVGAQAGAKAKLAAADVSEKPSSSTANR